jgi:hypothetical protein
MGMAQREAALREVIGEYKDEQSLTASRLDALRIRRTRLELARELLVEHGQESEADDLQTRIYEFDRQIEASTATLSKLTGLIATYQSTLKKVERAGSGS